MGRQDQVLGQSESREPKEYGFESGSWQLNLILEMIRREFGIDCRIRTLRRKLHATERTGPYRGRKIREQIVKFCLMEPRNYIKNSLK